MLQYFHLLRLRYLNTLTIIKVFDKNVNNIARVPDGEFLPLIRLRPFWQKSRSCRTYQCKCTDHVMTLLIYLFKLLDFLTCAEMGYCPRLWYRAGQRIAFFSAHFIIFIVTHTNLVPLSSIEKFQAVKFNQNWHLTSHGHAFNQNPDSQPNHMEGRTEEDGGDRFIDFSETDVTAWLLETIQRGSWDRTTTGCVYVCEWEKERELNAPFSGSVVQPSHQHTLTKVWCNTQGQSRPYKQSWQLLESSSTPFGLTFSKPNWLRELRERSVSPQSSRNRSWHDDDM